MILTRALAGAAGFMLCQVLPLACGPASHEASSPPALLAHKDCVVIVLDALDAGHLGCHGGPADVSPNIDALAAAGIRLERAWSQASWTLPSTVSLFTGLFPQTHGVEPVAGAEMAGRAVKGVRLSERAQTLPELFADAGYDTRMFTQNPYASAVYGLAQGVEDYQEVRVDDQGVDLAELVMQNLARRDHRPLFAYVHFRRPHPPLDAAPEFLGDLGPADEHSPVDGSNESIEARNNGVVSWSDADLQRHVALYHANIRHVDAAVGRLLKSIDLEQTLVVLLSDHGEAFGQHKKLGHNWLSYEEYVHVPWIMSGPSLSAGVVIESPVMTIDLLPTLVEWFGLESPVPAPQGRSLASVLAGGTAPARLVFTASRKDLQGVRQLAVSDGRHKLLRRIPNGREWLFDLESDPEELRDLRGKSDDIARRLGRSLSDWYSTQRPLLHQADVELDEDTLERLRALGYVLDGR